MYTGTYRIVQVSDTKYMVEELRMVPRDRPWPWTPRRWVEEWNRIGHSPYIPGLPAPPLPPIPPYIGFGTVEDAQKWVDDKRKYPLVVKEPA